MTCQTAFFFNVIQHDIPLHWCLRAWATFSWWQFDIFCDFLLTSVSQIRYLRSDDCDSWDPIPFFHSHMTEHGAGRVQGQRNNFILFLYFSLFSRQNMRKQNHVVIYMPWNPESKSIITLKSQICRQWSCSLFKTILIKLLWLCK